MKTLSFSASPAIVSALFIALAVPHALAGQIVRGQVVDSVTGTPLAGGVVLLLDETGAEAGRTLTDPDGLFLLRAPSAGQFRLRAEGEGYRVSEFPPFGLAVDEMKAYRLLVPSIEAPPPGSDVDPEALIERICGDGGLPGQPVIMGLVRDAASGDPVPEAGVILSWPTVPTAIQDRVTNLEDAQGVAVAGETGFYAVCGPPVETQILLHADHQGKLSEMLKLRFEGSGVYVGETFNQMTSRIWRQDLDLLGLAERTGSIAGSVTDTSGRRVANATVSIVGTTLSARAGLFGEFRFTGLPPGHFRLAAEGLGYRPARAEVELAAGEALELPPALLALTPAPTELPPVVVEAERPETRRNLAEFERRRRTTTGDFVTRAEWTEQGNPDRTTQVLRRLSGLRVTPGTGLAQPWRITTTRAGRGDCFPAVYIDRLYVGNTANITVDNTLPLEQLEAIEFYRSTAGMPPEFNRGQGGCGVLVFWTR